MRKILASSILIIFALWGSVALAQQQRKYPVDPETRWAVGAKQKTAEELKSQLASGTEVLIIDVRNAASFQRESLPHAINIPLAELEGHLKTIPKDKMLVFT